MNLLDSKSLEEITGVQHDVRRVSDLAYAVMQHEYDRSLLADVLAKAIQLKEKAQQRFLELCHLRRAHIEIPEIRELMYCRQRLDRLSEVAGVRLEPYPITQAASHVNFYDPGKLPIAFHTDGAAMVELIPLRSDGTSGGATLLFSAPAEQGEFLLRQGRSLPPEKIKRVPHAIGRSVMLQGRIILHSAEPIPDGERVTLVLVMRSVSEPWKDDNDLMRICLDDALDDVQDEWIRDVMQRKLPSYRKMLAVRSPS